MSRTRVYGISRQEAIRTLSKIRASMLNLEHDRLMEAIRLTAPEQLHRLVVVDGALACRTGV